ncbi:MAG: AAA family ATPase [Bacteroidetes bacterium HGW-Bacteroidetes-11]|nr:MAG: AAA family ATPase [Bacteroidetes bacterium HGW-Bacteroidetes-11]
MKIQLPTKKGSPNTRPELEFTRIVVVGANGSGKTRFGAKIEEDNHLITHRISAQKSLSIPKLVRPTSIDVARTEFFVGSKHPDKEVNNGLDYKKRNRWGNNFSTHLLDDFEKLLVLLHTEEYETLSDSKEQNILSPETKIDIVKRIWEKVLPHRKLKIKAGVIDTFPTLHEANKYNASEMSDGERVIFYLIAEVVCSPKDSILIIDKPEMHIHKSLVKKLFDLIENQRLDCCFIYLTHDIDFAFSRHNTVKIWTKSFEEGETWDYEILNDKSPIPEQLYLEILGSRNPILFIEGDESSIDYMLYGQVYDEYTIKPLGSCEKVIHSVKSLNEQNAFHNIKSFGIIDRDRKQNDDIIQLNAKNIWVLDVAEAENLLLIEEIIRAVATHMGKDPDNVFSQVNQALLSYFNSQIESQIMLHYYEALRREMIKASLFSKKNIADVIIEVDSNFNGIDKLKLYTDIKTEFEQILNTSDYEGVLRVFNLKNALIPSSNVCGLTDIRNKAAFLNLVISLLKKKDEVSETIKEAIDSKIIKNAK